MEFLREIAHLRVRSNTFGAVFRVRNALSFAIHKFFQDRGFLYVHTPLITASDAEGAGAMFRVTTLPPGPANPAEDFFGRNTYLAVSGQLEAEIFAPGLHQRLHLRPHLPRREFQHPAPPRRILDDRARDGLLRSGWQPQAGRRIPEVHHRLRPGPLPPRFRNSSTSASTTRCWRR